MLHVAFEAYKRPSPYSPRDPAGEGQALPRVGRLRARHEGSDKVAPKRVWSFRVNGKFHAARLSAPMVVNQATTSR